MQRTLIDARNYSCTGGLMELIGAIKLVAVGKELEVLTADPNAPAELSEWVRKVHHELVGAAQANGIWRIVVKKTH